MHNSLKTFTVLLMIFLTSCQTAEMVMEEEGLSPLTGEELVQLVSGNTAYGIDPYGASWVEYMAKNGDAYFKYHHEKLEVGRWEVNGNEICFLYNDLKTKIPFCFNQYIDENSHRTIFTTTFKKGEWGDTIQRYQSGDVEGLMQ